MQICEREAGDIKRLKSLARRERLADQRDRLLAVVHAIEGRETLDIAGSLGRSRAFVQRWVYAYRDGGVDALRALPRGGSAPKIRGERAEFLKARIDGGPIESDRVCTLRGKDVQRIMREEFGTSVSLSSAYRTLHRLGYSCLAPRPRHERQDLKAQRRFKEEIAPFLSARSAKP